METATATPENAGSASPVGGEAAAALLPWQPTADELRENGFLPMHEAVPSMAFGVWPGWWSGPGHSDKYRLCVGASAFSERHEVVIRSQRYGTWQGPGFCGVMADYSELTHLLWQTGYLQAQREYINLPAR